MTRQGPVSRAAATGDQLATLEAMRGRLAEVLDDCPPYVSPRIASQLVSVLKRIGELETAAAKPTLSDALAERRAKRERRDA